MKKIISIIKNICYNEVSSLRNKYMKGDTIMKKYVCVVCGYIYDPEIGDPDNGVEAGVAWEDVPEDWLCPLCQVGKDQFEEVEE